MKCQNVVLFSQPYQILYDGGRSTFQVLPASHWRLYDLHILASPGFGDVLCSSVNWWVHLVG